MFSLGAQWSREMGSGGYGSQAVVEAVLVSGGVRMDMVARMVAKRAERRRGNGKQQATRAEQVALKEQAYKLGLATILRASCCSIAAFILKSKYDNMLVTQAQRSPRQGSARDVEAAISQEELRGDNGP